MALTDQSNKVKSRCGAGQSASSIGRATEVAGPFEGGPQESGAARGGAISLPVLAAAESGVVRPAGIRPSKNGKRRAIVLATIQGLLIAHIVLWLLSQKFGWFGGATLTPIEPSESMEFSKNGAINAGLIFFSIALLSTLILGRWFCGWGCHIVMLQDLCGWMMKKVGVRPKPFRARLLLYVPLALAIYMFILPAVHRWMLVPLDTKLVASLGAENWLVGTLRMISGALGFPLPIHLPEWKVTNHLTTTGFWDTFVGPLIAIPFLFICGFATVYFLGAKGFCTYGCPYGGFFAPLDKYAPGRIRVTDACEQCGHCTAVCTSNVRVHEEVREYGMVVDPGCMKCLDCVSVCPNDALYFGFGKPAVAKGEPRNEAPSRKYDLSWPEEIVLLLVFIGAFLGVRGIYGLVPMLMAVGVAGCATFLVWKLWRMMRDANVNMHKFRLKYRGKLSRSGWVFATLSMVFLLFIVHSGVVRATWMAANRQANRAAVPPEIVFDESQPLPEGTIEHGRRAIALYKFLNFIGDGGIALARSDWQTEMELSAAQTHLSMREFDEAIELSKKSIERTGETDRAASLQTIALRGAGRNSEAEEIYQRLIPADEQYTTLMQEYAIWCMNRGTPFDVITVLKERRENYPYDAPTLRVLSQLLIETGQYKDAQPILRRLIELSPGFAESYGRLAGLLLVEGKLKEAEDVLRAGLEDSPDDRMLNGQMGQLLSAQGRDVEAQAYLIKARK